MTLDAQTAAEEYGLDTDNPFATAPASHVVTLWEREIERRSYLNDRYGITHNELPDVTCLRLEQERTEGEARRDCKIYLNHIQTLRLSAERAQYWNKHIQPLINESEEKSWDIGLGFREWDNILEDQDLAYYLRLQYNTQSKLYQNLNDTLKLSGRKFVTVVDPVTFAPVAILPDPQRGFVIEYDFDIMTGASEDNIKQEVEEPTVETLPWYKTMLHKLVGFFK